MLDKLPQWLFRFLEWTCAEKYLNELEGDLLELFERDVNELGVQTSKKELHQTSLIFRSLVQAP